MLGIDLTTVLVIIGAVILLFLLLDFLFAGGGMTGGMTLAPAVTQVQVWAQRRSAVRR